MKLVGQKTFGKGIIQNLQPLRAGGVAVTVARYETPQHHNINKVRKKNCFMSCILFSFSSCIYEQ